MTDLLISLSCDGTARDRHRPRSLDAFAREPAGWRAIVEEAVTPPGGPHARGGVERAARSWRLTCPLCPLDVRVADAVLTAVLDRAAAAGVDTLTLAALELVTRGGTRVG